MNIALCSAFRDSTAYIDHYFAQVGALRAQLTARGDRLMLVVGEGDSADDTCARLYAALVAGQYEATVLDVTHGGPYHGSVVHPERFRQLAYVWNEIWSAIPPYADAILYVESDLVWEPETALALLDGLADCPMLAPKILMPKLGKDFFYDVWGFRKDGWQFRPNPPYFSDYADDPTDAKPVQIDSAGSLLAIRGELARQLIWPEADVCVGLCRQVYELGGSVWFDPKLTVIHP